MSLAEPCRGESGVDGTGLFKIGPGRKQLSSRPMSLITCDLDHGYWTVASKDLESADFRFGMRRRPAKVVNNFMTGNDADARFT